MTQIFGLMAEAPPASLACCTSQVPSTFGVVEDLYPGLGETWAQGQDLPSGVTASLGYQTQHT